MSDENKKYMDQLSRDYLKGFGGGQDEPEPAAAPTPTPGGTTTGLPGRPAASAADDAAAPDQPRPAAEAAEPGETAAESAARRIRAEPHPGATDGGVKPVKPGLATLILHLLRRIFRRG